MPFLLKQDGDRLLNQGGDGLLVQRPNIEARVSADTPLQAPAVLVAASQSWVSVSDPLSPPSILVAPSQSWVSDSGPLSPPLIFGLVQCGYIADSGPLGSPRIQGWYDFSSEFSSITRYVCDIVTPSGEVRAKMSSWQATLQSGRSNYVQCVIPAAESYAEDIAAATSFKISVSGTTPAGKVEYLVAQMAAPQVDLATSANKSTATLSGYSEGFAEDLDPPEYFNKNLQGIRTIFTSAAGYRVRCSIDYFVRPSHRVFIDETQNFVCSYINYYVSGTGDAYMDVGERG